ncbi:MAG: glycosyltransferase [Candidatus Marinimicrobia bacterium]|mgnify:CR=1 FL=1|jgi:glycosyltransferase involved in cell wall biosynthesis|nr:glycosyltransferase [Candidatus Neomarinimicrobiota bacterium]MDP6610834.1 glycosyltransferase [Candidatus Neomarinimicrobiota bacterium]|tara:strand:+ start:4272 stop:5384 length:1113 start_codon:yes stop_codon:yes gene_type:complete
MEKKLNIFFSNSISAHKWGGGEKWMIGAARGLKARGHEVTLSGKANSVFLRKAKDANLDILPLNIYADYNLFKIWHTKRILKRKRVDVIVLNLNKDIRVAGIAARMAKVPVIIARNGIQLFSDKWKHKKTIGIVDGIITNSESIRNAYNTFPWMAQEKTTVIYNGLKMNGMVEPADVHTIWNIPKDNLVFVAAGRLTGQKGFDLLIEATSRMNGSARPFTVLIAGMGKNRKALEKQIDESQLNGSVKLIGFQNNLPAILKAADYIIMPSRQEGMPNVVMESMALGKPVLAANVNGVPELMNHRKTGFIFEPRKVNAICKAMDFALENYGSDEIANWGSAAKKHVEDHFTLDTMIDRLESYFFEQYGQSNR